MRLSELLLPPANLLLLAVAGYALLRVAPRTGRALIAGAVVLLYLMSTPLVSEFALDTIQWGVPLDRSRIAEATAIVVLGGGSNRDAVEYGGDTVNFRTLERIRYAARLHRETGLPILTTGGKPPEYNESEAALMKRALEEDFLVSVRWIEPDSATTAENAANSAPLLKAAGVNTIVLVTHAYHMRRAKIEFERHGLAVQPAPTDISGPGEVTASDFVPAIRSLYASYYAMHEAIGMVWYALKSRP